MQAEIKMIADMITKLGDAGQTAFIIYIVYAFLRFIIGIGAFVFLIRLITLKIYHGIKSSSINREICKLLKWRTYEGENYMSEKNREKLMNVIEKHKEELVER